MYFKLESLSLSLSVKFIEENKIPVGMFWRKMGGVRLLRAKGEGMVVFHGG